MIDDKLLSEISAKLLELNIKENELKEELRKVKEDKVKEIIRWENHTIIGDKNELNKN